MKILVAGIGNIFLGDDAFGVEVVKRLRTFSWPTGVSVVDFGIRGLDLTYALTDGYDAVLLIDAIRLNGDPGTLYCLEINPQDVGDESSWDGHALHPLRVLQAAKAMGGSLKRVLLVGCEPETLGEQEQFEGRLGLSPAVEASLDEAAQMVLSRVKELIEEVRNEQRKAFENARDIRGGGVDAGIAAGY